ncbi:hypothetical protein [Vibrio harveyi]
MMKQPPYKVEFGQSGELPPAHVVAIDKTSIKLSKNTEEAIQMFVLMNFISMVGLNQKKLHR